MRPIKRPLQGSRIELGVGPTHWQAGGGHRTEERFDTSKEPLGECDWCANDYVILECGWPRTIHFRPLSRSLLNRSNA